MDLIVVLSSSLSVLFKADQAQNSSHNSFSIEFCSEIFKNYFYIFTVCSNLFTKCNTEVVNHILIDCSRTIKYPRSSEIRVFHRISI